jgi:peptidyl-prolyl cis-trans isomerase C
MAMANRPRSPTPFLLALALAVAACGQGGGGERRPAHTGDVEVAAEGGAVVAEVDGVPITAERVARLAEETGEPPREVVERLIDFELLAAESRRRGLASGGDLRETTRKAMVQRYLAEDFERPRTVSAMPDSWLRGAYERNKGQFVHPVLRKVVHILVRKGESPAARARELALGEKIHREAVKAASQEEFLALAERFDGADGQKVVGEVLSAPVHERANLAKEFVVAAMALDRPGEISPPVQSSFGTHVIYLVDIKAAIDRSFDEVRAEVGEKEHPYWLQAEFAALVERLRRERAVEGYEGDLRRGDEAR